jgi:hypothetical protein
VKTASQNHRITRERLENPPPYLRGHSHQQCKVAVKA